MKQEDTKQRILDKALELFSTQGYDSVSVGEIAKAVGIKAPSLYNHFPSKQAIFDAIMKSTAEQYEADTDQINIHVQNAAQDIPVFTEITADVLYEKVRQIFEYSLHNETISRFRRMMTIEQFRSPELAALYSKRYVERVLDYHAGIFRALIAAGEIIAEDPDTLAMLYVSPVLTLIGICDRQPERESECLEKLQNHVQLFFAWFMAAIKKAMNVMHEPDKKWALCPVCGAKTRLRLLQRTVLEDFPLFCPKCRQERIINARNFQIEIIDQPDAKTQC